MATQKGRNWSSGDIVTAANLSSIERGVSAVTEEYTPTTWANGDTVTAAALNNIEQGIANAGGSSDISTAEVVFTDTTEGAGSISFYGYHENDTYNYVLTAFAKVGETHYSYYRLPRNSSTTFTLYLVGGYGIVDTIGQNVAVTGNAEVVYDSGIGGDVVRITGDCTITISDSSSGETF